MVLKGLLTIASAMTERPPSPLADAGGDPVRCLAQSGAASVSLPRGSGYPESCAFVVCWLGWLVFDDLFGYAGLVGASVLLGLGDRQFGCPLVCWMWASSSAG